MSFDIIVGALLRWRGEGRGPDGVLVGVSATEFMNVRRIRLTVSSSEPRPRTRTWGEDFPE